jgi:hypothetical protein
MWPTTEKWLSPRAKDSRCRHREKKTGAYENKDMTDPDDTKNKNPNNQQLTIKIFMNLTK